MVPRGQSRGGTTMVPRGQSHGRTTMVGSRMVRGRKASGSFAKSREGPTRVVPRDDGPKYFGLEDLPESSGDKSGLTGRMRQSRGQRESRGHSLGQFQRQGCNSDPSLYSLEVHHGGRFSVRPMKLYTGGKIDTFHDLHPDYILMLEMEAMAQDLGTNKEVVKMLDFLHKDRVAKVYLDHEGGETLLESQVGSSNIIAPHQSDPHLEKLFEVEVCDLTLETEHNVGAIDGGTGLGPTDGGTGFGPNDGGIGFGSTDGGTGFDVDTDLGFQDMLLMDPSVGFDIEFGIGSDYVNLNEDIGNGDLGFDATDILEFEGNRVILKKNIDKEEEFVSVPKDKFKGPKVCEDEILSDGDSKYDSDYSFSNSSDDENGHNRRKYNFKTFRPETDMEDPRFKVGQLFSTTQDFKAAVKQQAIKHRRPLKLVKNDKRRVRARCQGAVKSAFANGCRKIIGVDGCHLKGEYNGQILTAVGVDPNNAMYPMAWAVIEGLIPTLNEMLPRAEHRYCCKHILSNFQKLFKGISFEDKFWACAKASHVSKFEEAMQRVKEEDEKAYDWLANIPPRYWSRSHLRETIKCDMVCKNLCEAFNRGILEARDKSIIEMLEWIRCYLSKRVLVRREWIKKYPNPLLPNIYDKIEALSNESGLCYATWFGDLQFQVKVGGQDGEQYSVDLNQRGNVVQARSRGNLVRGGAGAMQRRGVRRGGTVVRGRG
ncbi:hypothetical protein RHSIM_Rhsim06G0098100 [Rhododendron simsii]|uniref:Transposase n=1 Tax=Rhododendron simsii TaxID=118357 RepID=A0A834GRP0_RHOSS|nr:hypothetical protein RHSIM_Rhsim06G0098100 [Rhododendron simsii]